MSYICVFKTLAYVNGHVSVWRKVSNNPELLQTDSIKLLNVEGYDCSSLITEKDHLNS